MSSSFLILTIGFIAGFICYAKPMWIILFLARWIKFALGESISSGFTDKNLGEMLLLLRNNQSEFEEKYHNDVSKIRKTGILVLLIISVGICGRIAGL